MNGVRIAQSGFTVSDPDYRQAYSSEWSVLNILATDFGSYVKGQTIVKHNLGYYPAFLIFIDRANNTQQVGSSTSIDGYNDDFFVDQEGLYHASTSTLDVANIRWYIFNVDLEKEFTAPNIQLGDDQSFRSAKEEIGVRFSRAGKTVKSRRFIDQNVRSDALIPLVHSVIPGVHAQDTTEHSHDLGYPPRVLAYIEDTSLGGYRLGVSAFDSQVITTSTLISYTAPSFVGNKESIIVFKDPLRITE